MIEAKFPPFVPEGLPHDGWKEWDGSADLPPDLSPEDEVDVLFRGTPMKERPFIKGFGGRTWCWRHVLGAGDIVAYRKVVKKEELTKEDSIPAPEGEGWVEWRGGCCGDRPDIDPCGPVQVQFRDGYYSSEVIPVEHYSWDHYDEPCDIIRYRVIRREEPPLQQPTTSQYQVGGDHYTSMAIQPWDAAKAWYGPVEYLGYHLITANAYLARHKSKGGLQDIKKARHHLDELIRYFEEDEDYPY